MSANRVKEQCLAVGGENSLVRALNGNELAGYAFATRWEYEGRQICWITQLCVKPEYRGHRLATRVIRILFTFMLSCNHLNEEALIATDSIQAERGRSRPSLWTTQLSPRRGHGSTTRLR